MFWLVDKERRELASSRALLVLLVLLGPLVGHGFITAVSSYAEVSGIDGAPAALAQGLSPLDGIVVPTFGAYALAVTLLYPFVAIRLVSSEKQSGALMLLIQAPPSLGTALAVKIAALLGAWVVAWIPGALALLLWRSYGGHLFAPEVAGVLLGHLLRATLTCAVALAAAAITDSAATAAVVTLAITLGTWALDFIAQVRGGLALALDAYTPEAALRTFETGEIRLAIVLVTLALALGAVIAALLWLHPGRSARSRIVGTGLVVLGTAAAAWLGARAKQSWDVSEDRRNSLSPDDERALSAIRSPLRVTVHLAPEDPRLADLERGVLRKLRRVLPEVQVEYVARGSSGLFERPSGQYGEVWYALSGRRAMSRSTTEPIVLETLYGLARIAPPAPQPSPAYTGYPLAARPAFAAALFYAAWPLLVVALWWWRRRPQRAAAPSPER